MLPALALRPGLLLALGAGALATRWLARRRASRYSFRDKTVLITGGSRGLGLLLARAVGAEGARVALLARDTEELARAQRDLAARGVTALAIPCDVTDAEAIPAAVREVATRLGPVDVLVNNAGVIVVGPLDTVTLADFDESLRVHFWGPLRMTMAVLPEMRRRRAGRIVNVSSIGGKLAVPHLLPYCAGKFALAGLSQGLGAELASDGVVVTTVFPGLMRIGSSRKAMFKGRYRAEHAWFSIAASLPGLSMDAERAARQIVEACRDGVAEVVLSVPARLAVLLQAGWPNVTAELLALANRVLPGPGGIGQRRALGESSGSAFSPSPLTALGDRAARRTNEVS